MAKKQRDPNMSKVREVDLNSDPDPNPYPEFESEVFEMYRANKLEPDEIVDAKERRKYLKWLVKNPEE